MENFFSGMNACNISALIIDLIFIIIIIYNIIKSARQGFISSLVSFILVIASYILVWPLSDVASKYIYNEWMKENICDIINKKLANKGMLNFNNIKSFLEDRMPGMGNYSAESFKNINEKMPLSDISSFMADKFIYPVINIIISIIILILLSMIFSMVIKLLKKFLKIFSYVPVLGKVNFVLGGIFGCLKSIVIIIFISLIINGLIFVSCDKWDFLNSNVKNETYIFKNCEKLIKINDLPNVMNDVKRSIYKNNNFFSKFIEGE